MKEKNDKDHFKWAVQSIFILMLLTTTITYNLYYGIGKNILIEVLAFVIMATIFTILYGIVHYIHLKLRGR